MRAARARSRSQSGDGGAPPDQRGAQPSRRLLGPPLGPYLLGSFLSNTGTWFQSIAQALLVYRLTGSVFLVGLINFTQFAGVLFLAPWAGAAADRFDRRRLLLVTQVGALLATAVLACLAWAGLASVPVVVVLALIISVTTAFAWPAQKALVTMLVDRPRLPSAVTLDSVGYNLARAVGPVLGVAVVASLGIPWAFALNSLSYALLIFVLLFIRPVIAATRPTARASLRKSLGVIWRDPRLSGLLLVIAATALSSDPVSTLTPSFSTQIFHQPDTLSGWLIGAFGAGAVLAGLLLVLRSSDPEQHLATMVGVMALGIGAFALSTSPALALLVLAIAGFGYLAAQTKATTLLQLRVDDAQRGRVMAVWSIAFLGTRPIASLIDGALAQYLGLQTAASVMALPVILAFLALAWRSYRRRAQASG